MECHTGSVLHDYRIQMSPILEEDEQTEFEIYVKPVLR
jgi:hypothetical protein